MQTDGLDEIQRRLGYRFQRSSLLIEALTHKSYLNEAKETGRVDNERLEFLDDEVQDRDAEKLQPLGSDSAGLLGFIQVGLVDQGFDAQAGPMEPVPDAALNRIQH